MLTMNAAEIDQEQAFAAMRQAGVHAGCALVLARDIDRIGLTANEVCGLAVRSPPFGSRRA